MTTFARGTGTAAQAAADALLEALHEDLGRLPASAQLDAVLCLLEAARVVLRAPDRPGEPASEDLDDIRATMRAASLSVRSYLWRTADNDPVARE
ncbi:hypothetical protein ACFFQW_01925 [Umezawaea endophytica]|uniref:Uncharacterized protein n=1 Tax=Umezawaea endophytica TaxID=1654476 RepID=A0A9X2VKU1_9PSEU|nr:hypothetical protein [Umezawaea endophytica]MCS7477008.1 hypothetical protein [Umezawaea endophytica]